MLMLMSMHKTTCIYDSYDCIRRFACGFSRSHVSYVSKTEVAWVCGNSLILLDVDTQKQVTKPSKYHVASNQSITVVLLTNLCASAAAGSVYNRVRNTLFCSQ